MQAISAQSVTLKTALLSLLWMTMLFAAFSDAVAQSVARPFPADGVIAIFSPQYSPVIVIDGVQRQLTAGAQIRDGNNMIVQPASLSGPDVRVIYKANVQGQIERIWILNADEAQQITSTIPASNIYVTPAAVVVPVPRQ